MFFEIWKKNEKYVFSNTGASNIRGAIWQLSNTSIVWSQQVSGMRQW